MELVIISFFTAFGKLYLLCRLIGAGKVVRLQKVFDVLFTLVVPLFFLGTLGGAVIAFLSGLWFSLMLWFLSRFVKPQPIIHLKKSKP